MMPRRKTVACEDKVRLIRTQRNGEDYQSIADILSINCSSAKSIVSKPTTRENIEVVEIIGVVEISQHQNERFHC